jgi:hypothetical protein
MRWFSCCDAVLLIALVLLLAHAADECRSCCSAVLPVLLFCLCCHSACAAVLLFCLFCRSACVAVLLCCCFALLLFCCSADSDYPAIDAGNACFADNAGDAVLPIMPVMLVLPVTLTMPLAKQHSR